MDLLKLRASDASLLDVMALQLLVASVASEGVSNNSEKRKRQIKHAYAMASEMMVHRETFRTDYVAPEQAETETHIKDAEPRIQQPTITEEDLLAAGFKPIPLVGEAEGQPYRYYKHANLSLLFIRFDVENGFYYGKHPNSGEYTVEIDTEKDITNYVQFAVQ